MAVELARVYATHGPSAIYGGSYGWASAGRFHHAQSQLHRFLNIAGGYTPSVGTYSFHAMQQAVPHIMGISAEQLMLGLPSWQDIADHADLVVAFGGLALKNSQVSPGGVHQHVAASGQALCREAGVRFINIGPCRDDLPDAEWIAPRPNTDVALILAMCHRIIDAGRHDQQFLSRCCIGFDQFRAYLNGDIDCVRKDADWAAEICQLPATIIVRLADQVAEQRTMITMSWSMQRADHGEQPCWAIIALAAIAGQIGHRGRGAGLGFGTHHSTGIKQRKYPVAALPQCADAAPRLKAIPVARITDMLLNPGQKIDFDGKTVTYPVTRLIYWCGGNPFHHHQDLNRLAKAWQIPETIIVHEPFWTATARHADIVLPVTTSLERNDFAHGRFESFLSAMPKAVDPPGEARDDYAIFTELAQRLGIHDGFTDGRTADDWVRHLYDQTKARLSDVGAHIADFDQFWREGHASITSAALSEDTATALELLRLDPGAHPLPTPSGRIELFSEKVAGFGYPDCPGYACWREPAEWLGGSPAKKYPLNLVSNQPKTRLHSQFDHGPFSRHSKIAGREPAIINPVDANRRNITDGDIIRIFNDRGASLAGATISADVMPGAIILATGAWYDPETPGGLDLHGNPNVLTLDKGTSPLAQGPSSGTVLVEVERWTGFAPPVRSFEPPTTLP